VAAAVLVFRLLFSSGWVRLISGDAYWRELTLWTLLSLRASYRVSSEGKAGSLEPSSGPLVVAGRHVDGDAVGVFNLESPLLNIVDIEGGFTSQSIGKDLVAHFQEAVAGCCEIRYPNPDVQVVEHATDVVGAAGAAVLENAKVVVSVAEIEAALLGGDYLQPQSVAPEANGFFQVGSPDADVNEYCGHRLPSFLINP